MANTKYFTVTVPPTEVPSDQTDVPVYLDLSVLAASHGFFTNARSDAGDVRIYNVTGTKTEVPREIVDYDAVAETGEIHFLADSLLSATDNVFQVEYGDGALTDYLATDTFGRNAVWGDYFSVHHMNDSAELIDSSGKTANATITGSIASVESPLGSGISIGTGDNEVLLSPPFPASFPTEFTISTWLQKKQANGVIRNLGDAAFQSGQFTSGHNFGDYRTYASGASGSSTATMTDSTMATDVWYHVVDRFDEDDPTSSIRLFRNGFEDTDVTTGAYPSGDQSSAPVVLSPIDNTFWSQMAVYFREHRIASKLLSDDQIAIEYANQNDPASFYTLSAEQDIGGGGTTYNESFTIGQSNELSPLGNIIVDDSIEIGQQSGILEESTLEGIASFVLSNQSIISLASQLLAEDAVQINQVSSVTVNGGLTVEDSFTLALQNAMSFEATEAVVVSFSLGSQSSVTPDSQLDAQDSIDLAQTSGLTLLDQLDASGTFVLNMQVAIGLLANAIVEAGLSISSLSEITVTGQSITSNVTLPDGRTLKIKLENRTLTIEKDNRTLDIS